MSGSRRIVLAVALATIVLVAGVLAGYAAVGGALSAIVLTTVVSAITIQDVARRAELRNDPVRPATGQTPLEQLRRIDKALVAARVSAYGVRPLLQPIAATRLARRGVHLERDREEARELLGDDLWTLVRPDRTVASGRLAAGMSSAGLESLIDRLERI